MRRLRRRHLAMAAVSGIAACGAAGCGCGGGGDGLSPNVPVTKGGDPVGKFAGTQSETAANVSNFQGRQVMTVTYNDDTDSSGSIVYGTTTRHVAAGTSMLGWSNSHDRGKTWSYGGTVPPPNGWPVLWGDPAIASDFADQRYVFISSLAVPASKMPAGGIDGSLAPYVGGACIAISTDGGVTFRIDQCLTNNLHFYDGSSMAAAGSAGDRRVFAAYEDTVTHRIDVWASPSDTGTFALLPDPFRGMVMASHPRLRFDRGSGALYVAALDHLGQVFLNRYLGGSWGRPALASHQSAGMADIQLSDRMLRTAYQFSFDVGARSAQHQDEVRILYTVRDSPSGKLYVRGSFCDLALTGCHDAPEWGTTPGNFNLHGQQFNPEVRAFPGFFGLPPVWKAVYESTDDDPGGNTVSYKEGNLVVLPNGTRSFLPFGLVKRQVVCPDTRGYWGDYDELQFAGFEPDSTTAQFILPHSDSTTGCPTRWMYTSNQLHVSAVVFK